MRGPWVLQYIVVGVENLPHFQSPINYKRYPTPVTADVNVSRLPLLPVCPRGPYPGDLPKLGSSPFPGFLAGLHVYYITPSVISVQA